MINDLNRTVVMGHIGDDRKATTNDNAPVRLAVATSSHWMVDNTRNTRTDWHTVVVFGNLRKYAAKLKKGDRVYIEAEARNNNFEKVIGGETVKFYQIEFIASQIDQLSTKTDTDE